MITLNDVLRLNHTASIVISESNGSIKAVLSRQIKNGQQATDIGIGKIVTDALADLEDALNEA